jgi:hypothetical protein
LRLGFWSDTTMAIILGSSEHLVWTETINSMYKALTTPNRMFFQWHCCHKAINMKTWLKTANFRHTSFDNDSSRMPTQKMTLWQHSMKALFSTIHYCRYYNLTFFYHRFQLKIFSFPIINLYINVFFPSSNGHSWEMKSNIMIVLILLRRRIYFFYLYFSDERPLCSYNFQYTILYEYCAPK